MLVVLGASGRIGGRIAVEALLRRYDVTAVLREGSRMDRGDGQVTVVRADAFDPAAVAEAVAGTDVVVNAVGHAARLDDQGYYVRLPRRGRRAVDLFLSAARRDRAWRADRVLPQHVRAEYLCACVGVAN